MGEDTQMLPHNSEQETAGWRQAISRHIEHSYVRRLARDASQARLVHADLDLATHEARYLERESRDGGRIDGRNETLRAAQLTSALYDSFEWRYLCVVVAEARAAAATAETDLERSERLYRMELELLRFQWRDPLPEGVTP